MRETLTKATLGTLALATVAGAAFVGSHAVPHATTTPATTPAVVTLAPCATEDSENCSWNAATQGNGNGRSFVNVNGTVYYITLGR